MHPVVSHGVIGRKGRDLRLHSSFNTNYSNYWVIAVIRLHRLLSNCGKH